MKKALGCKRSVNASVCRLQGVEEVPRKAPMLNFI